MCRGWRTLVFESPYRLDLGLLCIPETPVRDTMLDFWPTLPLVILGQVSSTSGADNIMAALERSNRICVISLLCL